MYDRNESCSWLQRESLVATTRAARDYNEDSLCPSRHQLTAATGNHFFAAFRQKTPLF